MHFLIFFDVIVLNVFSQLMRGSYLYNFRATEKAATQRTTSNM